MSVSVNVPAFDFGPYPMTRWMHSGLPAGGRRPVAAFGNSIGDKQQLMYSPLL